MLIAKTPGYIIEQEQLQNRGNGSNPIVTRITTTDGLFCVEVLGPRVRPSQIRVTDKHGTDHDHGFWAYMKWVLDFNLHELRGLSPDERLAYIKRKRLEAGFKK